MKRSKTFLGFLVAPVLVFALSSCGVLGFGAEETNRQNTKIVMKLVEELESSGELPEGVTFYRADFAQTMTDYYEVTLGVEIPEGVSLAEVNEILCRAVWLSEVTPLRTITLLERDPTSAELAATGPDDLLPDPNFSLSVGEPGTAEHESYVERWGERPVEE